MSFTCGCSKLIYPLTRFLKLFEPLGYFLARVWIAQIFWQAGMVKIQSWQSTMMLFQHEYAVPFLSAYWAAIIGTGAEILLPILLILGLGGRLSILVFFIYNLIAATSYPHLWTPEGAGGLAQHINWAIILVLILFHGPGKWSIDHFIRKRYEQGLHRHEAEKMKKVASMVQGQTPPLSTEDDQHV